MQAYKTIRILLIGVLLVFCIQISRPAKADLYWCDTGPNSSALVQVRLEGAECRLIEKDPQQQPPKTPQNGKSPNTSNASTNPLDFPSVSPEEQATRDGSREEILKLELSDEIAKLEGIRSRINFNANKDINPQLYEYYNQRIERHTHNIRALRQELARLQ